MSGRPVQLPFEPHPVFGVLHPGGAAADVAVLFVPPFGWEDMTSHRTRRDWAEQLAAEGRPVLRIDLPGSGDSGGTPLDPGLPEAWLRAVAGAARWLREHTGAGRLAAVGIGLGGLLAAEAAGRGAPIDDLVLWGVPARGRTLVRELRAFSRMEASGHAAQGAPPDPGLPDGALAAAGYLMTAETRAGVEAIDLTALPPFGDRTVRALVLERDGVPADPDLAGALTAAGAEVAVDPGRGYAMTILGDMQRVEVPTETFEAVSAWLGAAKGGAPGEAVRGESAAPGEAVRGVELAAGDGRVRETGLVLAGTRGDLAAVLAEPVDRSPELCLVLLNAGPQRRTGPNRMWVELSRRWAARGVAALRLDSAGIGDSDGVPAGWEQESLLYEPGRLDDLTVALDALERRGLPPRFALIGLCSGANWAFHAAQRDPRVVAALLLNPRALFWAPWMERRSQARRAHAAASGGSLRRLLRGEIPPRRAAQAALALVTWRLRRTAKPAAATERLERALAVLEERRLLVLFTDREPLRDDLEADGGLAVLAAAPGVRLELVPSIAEMHTLPQLWLQRRVHEIVDEELAALAAPAVEARSTARGGPRTPGRA